MHSSDTVANANLGMAGLNVNTGIPGAPPITTVAPQKPPSWRKWVIIGVVVAVILAGSGLTVLLSRPPALVPTIDVSSHYIDNGIPLDPVVQRWYNCCTSQGNSLPLTLQITFLLDSTAIKQDMQAESDSNGNVSTDLTVTTDWSIGQHMLIAHDASNNTTKIGKAISNSHEHVFVFDFVFVFLVFVVLLLFLFFFFLSVFG